jgi:hypothetical protein
MEDRVLKRAKRGDPVLYTIPIQVSEKLVLEIAALGQLPSVFFSDFVERYLGSGEGLARMSGPFENSSPESSGMTTGQFIKVLIENAEEDVSLAQPLGLLRLYLKLGRVDPSVEDLRKARKARGSDRALNQFVRVGKLQINRLAKKLGIESPFLPPRGKGKDRRHPIDETFLDELNALFEGDQDLKNKAEELDPFIGVVDSGIPKS